jgi:hypothetical protein
LRLVGGALKEAVHTYVLFILNVQVSSDENPQKSRPYGFFGNPTRVVWFLQKRERMAGKCLCNGFFKTYALIPC